MAQQTPYIGSKISLISKLDIRYEGILYTVDSKESTIALSKVRSFGTEDRSSAHVVPPQEEVYDYIIFKANDIKDLIVCEMPKPAAPGLAYDPAILSVSEKPAESPMSTPKAPNELKANRSTTPVSVRSGNNDRQQRPQKVDNRGPNRNYNNGRGGQDNQNKNYRYDNRDGQPQRYDNNRDGQPQRYDNNRDGQPQRYQNRDGQNRYDNRDGRPRYDNRDGQQRYDNRDGQQRYENRDGQQRYENRDGQQRFNNGRGNYNNRSRGQGGNNRGAPRQTLKFDTDYDFEKANKQFKETMDSLVKAVEASKLDVEDGSEEVRPESPEQVYYDKNVSFFDHISCEAREKEEEKNTRPDWRKERLTNQETFGQQSVRSYGYHRRGNNQRGTFRRNNNFR